MKPSNRQIVFAPAALRDWETAALAAIAARGSVQAAEYIDMLDYICRWIEESPEMGQARDDIRQDLCVSPVSQHAVYYLFTADEIRIIRILHSRLEPSAVADIWS